MILSLRRGSVTGERGGGGGDLELIACGLTAATLVDGRLLCTHHSLRRVRHVAHKPAPPQRERERGIMCMKEATCPSP